MCSPWERWGEGGSGAVPATGAIMPAGGGGATVAAREPKELACSGKEREGVPPVAPCPTRACNTSGNALFCAQGPLLTGLPRPARAMPAGSASTLVAGHQKEAAIKRGAAGSRRGAWSKGAARTATVSRGANAGGGLASGGSRIRAGRGCRSNTAMCADDPEPSRARSSHFVMSTGAAQCSAPFAARGSEGAPN